jgi:hypothetical protein
MIKVNRRDFMKSLGLVGLIGFNTIEAKEVSNPKWKDCENIESQNPCGERLVACYHNNCSADKNCPYK